MRDTDAGKHHDAPRDLRRMHPLAQQMSMSRVPQSRRPINFPFRNIFRLHERAKNMPLTTL
jgi:hypothetical protein